MKRLFLSAVLIVMLIGCKKEYKTPLHQVPPEDFQDLPKCGNDLNPEFSAKMMKARRSRDEQEIVNRRKPKDDPDPLATPTVIYLDADGQTVANTAWNWDQAIHCRPAGLTTDQMNTIVKSVTEDFSTFQVMVTSDETLFNQAPKQKRVRVIITTHEGLENFFPTYGGYAFIGSLWWGDDTPCFVFTESFGGNAANIAEVTSHEAGHTIGLFHQSEFSFDGQFLFEYHRGFFSVPFGMTWKPIMGVSYNSHISGWMLGRTFSGLQDDTKILSAMGVHADEPSDSWLTATPLKFNGPSKNVSFAGLLNNRNDADFYLVPAGKLKFSVVAGGNCDLEVVVYDKDDQVIAQFNDRDGLGISEKTIHTKGNRIYIKVFLNTLLIGDVSSEMQFAGQYTLVVNKE